MTDALDVMAGRRAAGKDFVSHLRRWLPRRLPARVPAAEVDGYPRLIYLPAQYVGTNRRFNHDRLFHLINRAPHHRFQTDLFAMPAPAAALLAPVFSGASRSRRRWTTSSASTTAGCSPT